MRFRSIKTIGLLAVTLVALVWIVFSLDVVLRKMVEMSLPDGVSISSIEGDLAGPIQIVGVTYTTPSQRISLDNALVHWRPTALLSAELELNVVELGNLTVVQITQPSAPPTTLPTRAILPDLTLPIDITLAALRLNSLLLPDEAGPGFTATNITASGSLNGGDISLTAGGTTDLGEFRLEAQVQSTEAWAHKLLVECSCETAGSVRASLSGNNRHSNLTIDAPTIGLHAAAGIDDLESAPTWLAEVRLATGGIPNLPLGLDLDGSGSLRNARLQGTARYGDDVLEFKLPDLLLQQRKVSVQNASFQLPQRGLSITGTADLPLDATLTGLSIDAGWKMMEPQSIQGQLTLKGAWSDYTGEMKAANAVDDQATLRFVGNLNGVQVEQGQIRSKNGGINLSGQASWTPKVAWSASGLASDFDPSRWLPEWAGSISGTFDGSGDESGNRLSIEDLAGGLRGRSIKGRASLSQQGNRVAAQGNLNSDRTKISFDATFDAGALSGDIDVRALSLSDWVPDSNGVIEGQIKFSGALEEPSLEGKLSLTNLKWADLQIARVDITSQPAGAGNNLIASMEDMTLGSSGQRISSLNLDLSGTPDGHSISLRGSANGGGVLATAFGSADAGAYQLEASQIQLETEFGTWELDQPLVARVDADRLILEPTCLRQNSSSLCGGTDWSTQSASRQVELHATRVPAALLVALAGQQSQLSIDSFIDGHFEYDSEAAQGDALEFDTSVTPGRLRLLTNANPDQIIELKKVWLTGTGDLDRVDLNAVIAVDQMMLDLQGNWLQPLSDGAINLQLKGEIPDLGDYEYLIPQVTGLTGAVAVDMTAGGPVSAPEILGNITVENLEVQVPDLGLTLTNGTFEGQFDGAKAAFIAAIDSGAGQIQLDSRFSWADQLRGDLNLSGSEFETASLPELTLTTAPDLRLVVDPAGVKLTGKVAIPKARIRLNSFAGSTTSVDLSKDVVVVDDPEKAAADPWPFASDVEVNIGSDVGLQGFGMDVELGGSLRIEEKPGRPSRGFGRLEIAGTYSAFGQKLNISNGRLLFAGDPLDDPALDLRATREVEDVVAGIAVSGRARSPSVEIFSQPAMDQSDALAYIVLGRPLNQVGQGDSDLLGAAALGLGVAGGNRVLSKLTGGQGFASIGIANRQELGGTAFSLARYLSPRLYLSYSIGLEKPVDLVELRYQLSRKWALETQVGEETRGAIKYKIERGKD